MKSLIKKILGPRGTALGRRILERLRRREIWNESGIWFCGIIPLWKCRTNLYGTVRKYYILGLPVGTITRSN